ncbi:DUF2303 family protein [Pseudomonas sp. B26(2017)]|uniref:DUF2303 family protein n=1 Tax=Pseudomonas sp. B26(2017) TaxID=1981732 RepID=UPI000A1EAA36|nr:DUF2303 family protein [Pseudomonas sp. B26(2017)]
MSLSKEALQLVIDAALSAAGATLPTHTPVVLVPESTKLTNLETYQAGRSRFRGTFSTTSLVDFGAYVQERGEGLGFIDQDAMSSVVYFNLGTPEVPGHADDKAALRLKATVAFNAVQEISGRRMAQRDLSDWIEDWNHNLTGFDAAGNALPIAKVVASIRNITIKSLSESDHAVTEVSTSRSAMDQIEATSKETLPANLVFTTSPYEGLSVREFTLRLSIITSGSAPALTLRWVGEAAQREEIAQEFKGVLLDQVQDKATLRLGAFDPR